MRNSLGQSEGPCSVRSCRARQRQVIEGGGRFGAEQRSHGAVGQLGQFHRDQVHAHGAQFVERGKIVAAVVIAAFARGRFLASCFSRFFFSSAVSPEAAC